MGRLNKEVFITILLAAFMTAIPIGLFVQHVVHPLIVPYSDPIPVFEPIIFWLGFATGGIFVGLSMILWVKYDPPILVGRNPEGGI